MAAIPAMRGYAFLRRDAFLHRSTIAGYLQSAQIQPQLEPKLCQFRCWFMGAALLSFNFRYHELVRWLGGEYTNAHRDWSALAQRFREASQVSALRHYPTLFPKLAMRSFQEGVPLTGVFISKRRDMIRHFCYDNHPPLQSALPDVREKFAKKEANSFHIVLPKFLALFLPGLMISPISWLVRNNKGRIIINTSSSLSPNDTGAPNPHIPPTGTPDRETENPPVFYGSALQRQSRLSGICASHTQQLSCSNTLMTLTLLSGGSCTTRSSLRSSATFFRSFL